jgi:hypothetical protein
MKRRLVFLSLTVLLISQLAPASAIACDKGKECDVERTCEKTESGVRCTIIAKGETTVEELRKCVSSCAGKHHSGEGVTVTFEEIEGGIAVIRTGSDADTIEALQAHADGCAKDHKGCCAKAHADGCAKAHKGCCAKAHAKQVKAEEGHGCAKPCGSPCPHSKAN